MCVVLWKRFLEQLSSVKFPHFFMLCHSVHGIEFIRKNKNPVLSTIFDLESSFFDASYFCGYFMSIFNPEHIEEKSFTFQVICVKSALNSTITHILTLKRNFHLIFLKLVFMCIIPSFFTCRQFNSCAIEFFFYYR